MIFCTHDKRVYNNTWWGSSAESAIVIADARHIDEMDIAKMLLLRNEVHGNQGGVNSFPNLTAIRNDLKGTIMYVHMG